jgi:hypothetical protein
VTYSPNRTPGQWKAHGHYLTREVATQRGDSKCAGFDCQEDRVDIAERLAAWQAAGDERLFKIIISPEFGERVDLPQLTRDLLERMEDQVGHLEWVAVAHFNTEYPHVHVALRGINERGEALRLPRPFIQFGIRQIAEELLTEQLGYRTERDALTAQRREVGQIRFTSLDRMIQRQQRGETGDFYVRAKALGFFEPSFTRTRQILLQARLSRLTEIGLAKEVDRNTWRVQGNFAEVLRTLQRTGDRQRMLARHMALASDAHMPLEITPLGTITFLEGRILGHGQEEHSDVPYLLVEGTDSRIHFLIQNKEMQLARGRGRLRVNSFIRLERRLDQGGAHIRIEDLGDARKLLQNRHYFREAARRLAKSGVSHIEVRCGGWLGAYQRKLSASLTGLHRGFMADIRREVRER